MRVLVFGRTGQVARELARRQPVGAEAWFLDRDAADLADPAACAAHIWPGWDAVINAAAFTSVDRAEAEEPLAHRVNAEAPAAVARACAARGVPFLHLSTDYVFSGAGMKPWHPDDPTDPQNAYGRTKRAGERAIIDSGARALILRTSWVFSAHGSNFVKTMLRLGAGRARLSVVADQLGGPTPAAALADALWAAARAMAAGAAGGVAHFAGAPDTSWSGFARAIMAGAGLSCAIDDIPSTDYPSPARRPANSRLDCTGFEARFGLARPDWRQGLAAVLQDLHKGVAR